MRVWSSVTGELLRTLQGSADAVTALGINGDGSVVVAGSYGGALQRWDGAATSSVRVAPAC